MKIKPIKLSKEYMQELDEIQNLLLEARDRFDSLKRQFEAEGDEMDSFAFECLHADFREMERPLEKVADAIDWMLEKNR